MYNYGLELSWLVKLTGFGTGKNEGLKIEFYEAYDTPLDLRLYPWKGYGVGEIINANKD
jgi:hypothetical protein